MNQVEIYTIGHSNHSAERFIALLMEHGIETLVDIRRFPSSRRLPHFNRSNLSEALAEHGIEYVWLECLGGHRKDGLADSPNFGLKDESFRNYADHMLGDDFREGADRLLEIAKIKPTAIMCGERSFRECHRKLLSDFLLTNGVTVQHIRPTGELLKHKLSEGAKTQDGEIIPPVVTHVDTITGMNDEATYICDNCGEEIVVPIDPSVGSSQQYVEDCPVCCNPDIVHVEIDEDGDVRV